MKDKIPEEKNELFEAIKMSWLPISVTLTIISAVTAIYNYYKLWQGDQEKITAITVFVGLMVLTITLLHLSLSKVSGKKLEKAGRKTKQDPKQFRYNLKIRRIALAFLATTFIAIVIGGIILQKQKAELANKIVVVIAAFDGPEDKYGVRNQIIEELANSLTDLNEVKIFPVSEIITPAQGRKQALKLGERYSADIVLWGWYRSTENPKFTLHIENLSFQELNILDKTHTIIPKATLAELESFSLQQSVGKETSGLITFLAGYVQFLSKNYESALVRFDKALEQTNWIGEVDVNQSDIYFFRGTTLGYLGQYEQAISDFNQAIQNNPDFTDAYNNRGCVYANLSQYEKALEDFNQTLRINPQFNAIYVIIR